MKTKAVMVCLLLVRAAGAAEWTDVTGKHKTEAEFDRLDYDAESGATSIRLKKPDGQIVTLPIERLSNVSKKAAANRISELVKAEMIEAAKILPAEFRTKGKPDRKAEQTQSFLKAIGHCGESGDEQKETLLVAGEAYYSLGEAARNKLTAGAWHTEQLLLWEVFDPGFALLRFSSIKTDEALNTLASFKVEGQKIFLGLRTEGIASEIAERVSAKIVRREK